MEWWNDRNDAEDLEQLQILEYLERVERVIHLERSIDLDVLDETDFRSLYRLNKSTVEAIIEMISPKLDGKGTSRIGEISSTEKVCVALRFMAEGSFQSTVGDMARISQPSACRAINSVAIALAELCREVIQFPDEREKNEISQNFLERCHFPKVLGTLDCTHIPIVCPGNNQAELFRCHKGFFSLNVQTLSDHNLKIRNIVARWPGGTHDSTVFDHSLLKSTLDTGDQNGYHVLGDSSYPLRPYLMTPFLSPKNNAEIRYNNAHVHARNCEERQYGVWKTRFSCLYHGLRGSLSNAQNIIIATGVLHNIAIDLGDRYELGCDPEPPGPSPIPDTIAGVEKRNLIVKNYFT